jgi:hypothetical protein
MPETAAQAVEAYDAHQTLDAIEILKGGNLPEQLAAWAETFNILRKAAAVGATFQKSSYLQFESWCFRYHLAVPAMPDQMKHSNAAKATAYSILREGFDVFVQRNIEARKLKIRKA